MFAKRIGKVYEGVYAALQSLPNVCAAARSAPMAMRMHRRVSASETVFREMTHEQIERNWARLPSLTRVYLLVRSGAYRASFVAIDDASARYTYVLRWDDVPPKERGTANTEDLVAAAHAATRGVLERNVRYRALASQWTASE